MKKILFLLLIIIILLTGCSKKTVVIEDFIIDKVVVSDVIYKPSSTYNTTSFIGKVIVPVRHTIPAYYAIVFNYKGTEIICKEKEIYELFKNRLNDEIECQMKIKVYDNKSFDLEMINFIERDNND